MIIRRRSPTLRHVSRILRVALDWLFDKIHLDPKIQIRYVDSRNRLADSLTKEHSTRDEWKHLLCLFNFRLFSSKRPQLGDYGQELLPHQNQKTTRLGQIHMFLHGPMTWKVMRRNVWNDIANWRTKLLNNCTKYQLHALMTTKSKKKDWNPWENCQTYVDKLSWRVFIWHELVDWIFYGSVNKLARATTTLDQSLWPNVWRVWSLTFIAQVNTNSIVTWEILHNNVDWDSFKDSDHAGDLEDSKSTSGWTLCVFGSHTFVPTSWMCKKQICVSHSSTDVEFISLDAGLQIHKIPALDLWDLIIEVLHSDSNRKQKLKPERRNPSSDKASVKKQSDTQNSLDISQVDFVSSNAKC